MVSTANLFTSLPLHYQLFYNKNTPKAIIKLLGCRRLIYYILFLVKFKFNTKLHIIS